ncbi:hypothetical protein F5Y15DRAFT_384673 [Xylariaceae sp. FL0016]|nr:hypothetical protein F5Y15DRAFT_384673 [Xylariaceae sp. FL0016]
MTYNGSAPPGQGSAYNGQPNHHQYPQQLQNSFDSWSNPQYQPQSYGHQVFQHATYPNAHQQPQAQLYQQQQPQQLPPAPVHNHQHNGYPHQHRTLQPTPQNVNYQFQPYEPSFDQRPYLQPSHQNHVNHSANQLLPSVQQPIQQPQHQQQIQVPNQHPQQRQYVQQPQQQQHQQFDWQHMPPPMSAPSPSYQQTQTLPQPTQTQPRPQPRSQPPTPTQSHNHLSQHVNSPIHVNSPVHINSPIMRQSPQMPSQPIPSSHAKSISASARIDQASRRVSASPRLSSQAITRSPSVSSTRSPATTPALVPHHKDYVALLVCMAEDFLARAGKKSRDVAEKDDEHHLHQYQKMVATGLRCLEVALNSNKLPPRVEARVRLRYASIICDETNNFMEGETALIKGVWLTEKNRFTDLKYMMQFQQVRQLYNQGKSKAAMIAVDNRIRDVECLKHIHWVYALRFLKASLYIQDACATETHAIENLRAIGALASQRGDHAIFVLACLLEGLSLLKASKDDSMLRVQNCIAQASKYQLEESVRVPQLDVLALMLDLACTLQQKSPNGVGQKLKALQDRLDASINDTTWAYDGAQLFLPIQRQPLNVQIISEDTSGVLKPGAESEGHDYLAMTFWSKLEVFAITYTYSGLALLYQQPRNDKRMFVMWEEALSQLQKNSKHIRGVPNSLAEAVQNASWRKEVFCYVQILRGLHCATHTQWDEVKSCLSHLEKIVQPGGSGLIELYCSYLEAIYLQGIGQLDQALEVYHKSWFDLQASDKQPKDRKAAELDVSLLATFNRIWIMQEPSRRNDRLTLELLDQLRPLCESHPNLEVRTAYNLVLAAIQTNPPIPMTAVKKHISTALNNAKVLGDVQTLSIALNLMRAKLFQSIVGDQALKSAKAASAQAKKSGNTLWMSVAEGMLAQSYDVQGQIFEAEKAWQDAIKFSTEAFKMREQ